MQHHFLIVLIDRQHGRLYQYSDTNPRLDLLEEVVDEVPKAVKSASWKGLADDRVARHIDEHVHNHFKRVIGKIPQYLDASRTTRGLIVGGPEEVRSDFLHALPSTLLDRLVGTLHPDHYAGNKKLVDEVQKTVSDAQSLAAHSLVALIEDARKPGERGVVGPEPVFESLNLKKIQSVILTDDAKFTGYWCAADGSISAVQSRCPTCLAPMETTEDLRDKIYELATAQRAEVIIVDDSILPVDYGDIAALLRFA